MSISGQLPSFSNASIHVLVFTKYPTPGYAKTRLIPAVGKECAADISRQLTERIVSVVRSLLCSLPFASSVVSRIHYTSTGADGDDAKRMREWLGAPDESSKDRETFVPQSKGDLGQRLDAAFAASFRDGAQKVVVVGADIPDIDVGLLEESFTKLDGADIVIGPAQDGGYYLLGMKQVHSGLFRDMPWSTERVFEVTMGIAAEEGLSVAKLRTLRDVDLPEDVTYFDNVFNSSGSYSTKR